MCDVLVFNASAVMDLSERHVYLTLQDELRKGIDKRFLAHVQATRQKGFGWRFDGLGDWSTEQIFAKLIDLGVDTSPERFREQAARAGQCKQLIGASENPHARFLGRAQARRISPVISLRVWFFRGPIDRWRANKNWDDSPWDDFPFFAAEELWRRLTPDVPCAELVADRLSATIRSVSHDESPPSEKDRDDVAAVMFVIDYLSRFAPELRAGKYQELLDSTIYDFSDWLLEFVLDHAKDRPDDVARVADVMSDADPDNAANYQGDLAVALAWAGRRDGALDRVQSNLAKFPNDVWIRIKAGDVYTELDRDEEAVALYVDALARAEGGYDWDGAYERLPSVLAKLGRSDGLKAIATQHPRPSDREVSSPLELEQNSGAFDPDFISAGQVVRDGPKVGRNDACPCGSGKKYKKCCLGRE